MVSRQAKYRRGYIAQGRCSSCNKPPLASKWYCKKCLEKLKIAHRKFYYKNHEAIKKRHRTYNWNKRFGHGTREKVVERDNHTCQICGYNKRIRVHHINENKLDNRLENLEAVTRSNHINIHKKSVEYQKCICPWCNKEFVASVRRVKGNQRNQGKAGPFCGKSCAGKYSQQFTSI